MIERESLSAKGPLESVLTKVGKEKKNKDNQFKALIII